MSNARQLAANLPREGGLSNRNMVINGSFAVAQRGMSNGPNTTNGVLALDRWHVNASGGTKTISQETFAAGQTDVPDFPKYYMRLAVTTGNNNLGVHQRVEDVTVLGGKTVTLSFWAKGTNPAGGSFVSSWIQDFGSGGSTAVETEAQSGIVLTSSWQKFTITFDVPSVSGKTIGTSSFTWVELLRQPATDTGTAGWTADIAQVQLEVGDTATPFEHRSYGDELARCQRYYEKLDDPMFRGVEISGLTARRMGCHFLVKKRATPTVSLDGTLRVYNGTGTTTITQSNLHTTWANNSSFNFDSNATISGNSAGQACVSYTATSGTVECSLLIDAEL